MKILCIFFLITVGFSQNNFTSKYFKYYKLNESSSINVLELINEKKGTFKVEVFGLEDLEYKRYKKTMNPYACELDFSIDSDISKEVDISICKGELIVNGFLLINDKSPEISISHEKFPLFEGTIIFVISGLFNQNSNKTDLNKDMNGILKEWYDNGNLYLEFIMKDGIKNGICKKWYNNGQLQMIYNYKQGKLHGTQKKWYKNGNKRGEWNYIDDLQHGISKEWYDNGILKLFKKFKNGELLEKSAYDQQGNKI